MPELTLLGVNSTQMGYGRLCVKLADALRARGVDVYDTLDAPTQSANELIAQIESGEKPKRTRVACWVSYPTHSRGWWEGQHPAVFSMWEASILPEAFRQTLHECKTVIVPSHQNVELFSRYHDNVHYVPLGIDPLDWYYVPRRPPNVTFDFLIGGSGERKGTDLAYEAFHKVFASELGGLGDGPTPRLVMKSPSGEEFPSGPNVQIITGKLSSADEIALYARSHCYLQPSRGEGFGLQPLQALALGMPTILTDAHGHAAYAHLGIPIGWEWSKAGNFMLGDAGQWWEPNFDELCDAMRWVYENYDRAASQAHMASRVVARDWTWGNTAARFEAVFGDLLDQPGPTNATRWIEPERKHYPVITNQTFSCDIQGTMHRFEKSELTYQIADVKRILFESRRLDPACLNFEPGSEGDVGLSEEQMTRVGAYKAEMAWCPECHQRLNSGEQRADVIFEELERAASV